MKKRYVMFIAAALVAGSVAVPAFGGPSNPVADTFASAKKTAKKAQKTAKKAKKAAKMAQKTADQGVADAAAAQARADKGVADAAAAQTTADKGVADAATAQATADQALADAASAQATADSKYGATTFVEGDTSPTDSNTSKIVSAGCGSGADVTSGGFIVNGAGNNDVTVSLSSRLLNGWVVTAREIGAGTASTWNVTATANCITQD